MTQHLSETSNIWISQLATQASYPIAPPLWSINYSIHSNFEHPLVPKMTIASFCVPNQFVSPNSNTTRLAALGKLRLRVSAVATSTTTTSASSSSSSSLYQVLGLQMGATLQEIKAAYRSLARTTHPDAVASSSTSTSTSTGDDFIKLHAAYSTLSDPKKRADYDRKLFPVCETRFSNYTSRSRTWETDQCW